MKTVFKVRVEPFGDEGYAECEKANRPPTRQEIWEYAQYWYGELKEENVLNAYAKELFVSIYVYYVNVLGWTLPPDWREGEPVVEAARPKRPFPPRNNTNEVYRLLALQRAQADIVHVQDRNTNREVTE